MLRVTTLTCALIALALPAAAGASTSPTGDAPVARVLGCDPSGTDRAAVFYGRMHAIPGAVRMAMRFTLVERLGREGDWEKAEVPQLRQWRRSALGVKTFAYRQRVEDLRTGGAYRAAVQFRWYGSAGTVLKTVTRQTRACRGELPNLQVGDLEVRRGPAPDTRLYRVTFRNAGEDVAENVAVQLQVDRAVLDAIRLDDLDAGEARTVTFTGPACENAVRARIDPGNSVGESSEADNARSWDCG